MTQYSVHLFIILVILPVVYAAEPGQEPCVEKHHRFQVPALTSIAAEHIYTPEFLDTYMSNQETFRDRIAGVDAALYTDLKKSSLLWHCLPAFDPTVIRKQEDQVRAMDHVGSSSLLAVSQRGNIAFFDYCNAEQVDSVSIGKGTIQSIKSLDDGKKIFVAHDEGFTVIDLDRMAVAASYNQETLVACTPSIGCNESLAAFSFYDRSIKLFDVRSGKRVIILPEQHQVFPFSLACHPYLPQLVSGNDSTEMILWDLRSSKSLIQLKHTIKLSRLSYDPQGVILAGGSHDTGTISLWKADQLTPLLESTHQDRPVAGRWSADRINDMIFHPSGRLIASTHNSGLVVVWDVSTKRIVARNLCHSHWGWSLSFNNKGDRLVCGGFDNRIVLWEPSQQIDSAKNLIEYVARRTARQSDRRTSAVQRVASRIVASNYKQTLSYRFTNKRSDTPNNH